MTITPEIIIAIGGVLATVIGALAGAFLSLRKAKPEMQRIAAEADEIQTRNWKILTDVLEGRLAKQEDEIKMLHKANDDLECEMGKLRDAKDHTDAENEKLRIRVRTLEAEVARIPSMELEIKSLRDQIVEMGGKPKTGPLSEKVN